jgi:hypothetical protein
MTRCAKTSIAADRSKPLLAALTISRDDLLEFVLMYTRMEYALKRAGFVRAGSNDRLIVEWSEFSQHIELRSESADSEFRRAAEFLLKQAPWKQVFRNGQLDFAPIEDEGGALSKKLIDRLKVVRNNLMHGGKYPHRRSVGEPGRNQALLQASVIVMNRILGKAESSNNPRVREVYASFGRDLD